MALSQALRDRIAKAQQKMQSGGGKYLRLEADKPLTVRVLPGEWGEEKLWFRTVGVHYFGNYNCGCPRINFGNSCPVCTQEQEARELEATVKTSIEENKRQGGSAEELKQLEAELAQVEQMIEDLRPSKRFLLNLLVDNKVRVYTAPWGVFDPMWQAFSTNVNTENIDIFDPNHNFPFEISKTGSGRNNTKYGARMIVVAKPLAVTPAGTPDQEAINKFISQRYDLDEEAKTETAEEIQTLLDKWLADPQSKPDKDERKTATSAPTQHHVSAPKAEPTPAPTPASSPAPTTGTASTTAAAALRARLAASKA